MRNGLLFPQESLQSDHRSAAFPLCIWGVADKPTNLSEGAKLGHKLIEEACHQKMRPIPPWQIINYDFTSTNTCRWTSGRVDGIGDKWVRVSTKSLHRGVRNHTSIKIRGEDSLCNGISVKWLDSTSASGSVFPMTMLFGGFEESVMPQDDFLFLDVAGLSVNGQLDARQHDAPGFVVLKKKGVSMQDFYSWYTNRVILPYYQVLREKHGLTNHAHIPEPEKARIWSDSDMTNIGAITAPQEMDRNYNNGLEFGKLGAKTTVFTQPMDNSNAFRTKKATDRKDMTDRALEIEITKQQKDLHDS
jgi:hypothetical protein